MLSGHFGSLIDVDRQHVQFQTIRTALIVLFVNFESRTSGYDPLVCTQYCKLIIMKLPNQKPDPCIKTTTRGFRQNWLRDCWKPQKFFRRPWWNYLSELGAHSADYYDKKITPQPEWLKSDSKNEKELKVSTDQEILSLIVWEKMESSSIACCHNWPSYYWILSIVLCD